MPRCRCGHAAPCVSNCWRRGVKPARRADLGREGPTRRGQIPPMTSIVARPAEVATRPVPGHWEGDLITGARNGSAIGPLVEWTSRVVLLARMEGLDAVCARQGLTKQLRHVPALRRKTLPYDRGNERAEHERLPSGSQSVSSLPIRTARGRAAPLITPPNCCASTCPRGRTSRGLCSGSGTPARIASTRAPENV